MMFLSIPIAYSSTNPGSYWGGGFGPKANFCKPKPRGRGFNIHYKLLMRYTVVICHGWNLPDKQIYCINDQNLLKNCMLGLWNTLLYKRFVVYRKFCGHHVWMVTKCACLHRMPIMISPRSVRPSTLLHIFTHRRRYGLLARRSATLCTWMEQNGQRPWDSLLWTTRALKHIKHLTLSILTQLFNSAFR